MKRALFYTFLISTITINAQTFTGGSGAILDNQTIDIPIVVTVPQSAINITDFGLETVCLNLTHTYVSDLTISIVAPDGTVKTLIDGIGGGEDNMVNTCLNQYAVENITSAIVPFTGTFKPMGQMGGVNNGQNPNGTWFLRVRDNYGQDEGSVENCSITFGSQPADYFQFTESDLPIVVIETNGAAIDNDIKVIVDMGIIYNGEGNRNYIVDSFNEYNGKIGIEYRGNYSLGLPQKPYSIELVDDLGVSVNQEILGMPAENDWLLLANYNDKSFARNVLPYHLFEQMGHYAVRSRYVDVVIDDEYQGIYLLAEKIKRDSNRVDISQLDPIETTGQDATGGYIVKIDYWDNSNSWPSTFSPIGSPGLDIHFVYYYPKPDEIVPEQQSYIQNFMQEFETVLYSNYFDNTVFGYRRYISVPSFIDYFIVNEFARNVDGFKKSRFFSKDKDHADGSYRKLKAGPVWDFDWALKDIDWGSEDGSNFMYDEVDQDVNAPGWYIRLLQDPIFADELHCRYANLRNSVMSLPYLFARIDSVANVVNESQAWHYTTWGHMGSASGTPEVQAPSQTYAEEVQRLKDWITRRIAWLDANMPGSLSGCTFIGLNELAEPEIDVYPNPFGSQLIVTIDNTNGESGTIVLKDATGRIVKTSQLSITASTQEILLSGLESLSSGVYLIEISIGERMFTKKVIH